MNLVELKEEGTSIFAVEDYLHTQGCFVNDRGETRSLESYGTLFEFNKLIKCLKEIKEIFPVENLKKMAHTWKSDSYLSPNLGLLGLMAEKIFIKS